MTKPRQFLPDQTHVIRHRVVDFRCGLATPEVQNVVMYCFGCACRKYPQIAPHALTIDPDGVELVITDRLLPRTDVERWQSQVSDFACLFFRMVAQYCNDRLGRVHHGFWRQGPYQPTSLEDDEARWKAVIDLALYPVQRGLAANVNTYPGYAFGPDDVGRTMRFEKPDFRFKWVALGDQPDDVEVKFVPLPGHTDTQAYRREFRRRRDDAERVLMANGPSGHRLTRAEVRELTFDDRLDQSSGELEYFPPRNGNDDQSVYAVDPARQRQARLRRQRFHLEYRNAWHVLRGKNWDAWSEIEFPPGTHLYRVRLGVGVRLTGLSQVA